MINRSIKSKIMTGVILASMIIGGSTGVFAASTSNETGSNLQRMQHDGKGKGNGFGTKLDELVSAGTITSDQETAIKTALTPQGDFKGGDHKDMFKNKLAELVAAGTITSDDQSAIEEVLSNGKGGFKTALDNLVTEGKLTQEKITAIESSLKPQGNSKDGKHEDKFKNKLAELVTSGTITSDDQTIIEEALTNAQGDLKTVLDNLVAEGKLTQEKITAIENTLKPQGKYKGEEKDNSQKTEEHNQMLKTKLDTLVSDGTITADQETSVIEAFTASK